MLSGLSGLGGMEAVLAGVSRSSCDFRPARQTKRILHSVTARGVVECGECVDVVSSWSQVGGLGILADAQEANWGFGK